jgi:hypothetical protein
MDQDTVVSEQTESGKRLIEALSAAGFEVRVAFWAKPTDEGKWFLYLASPVVDEKGPTAAYRHVYNVMRKIPDLWIDPLEVRVVGSKDSLTEAVLAATKPKVPDSPFGVRNPKSYPGMTRFGGSTLGGVSIEGAYIYPPQPGASARGGTG